jgi:hypothetical protein
MSKKPEKQKQSEVLLLPEQIGLDPAKYEAAINYLFDRPESSRTMGEEWYWNYEEKPFEATPLEWVRIQTVLFSRCGLDLARFSENQIGMGLHYIMDSGVSEVSMSALDKSVDVRESLRMMRHFPTLWRDCIGARMSDVFDPIGACKRGRFGYVCYMWFDVWALGYVRQSDPIWTEAIWNVLKEILSIDVREVQIAALHGIGHCAVGLGLDDEVEKVVRSFWLGLKDKDEELKSYAKAAAKGMVQ